MADAPVEAPVIEEVPSIDESAKLFQQSLDQDKPISELQKPAPKAEPKETPKEPAKEAPKVEPKPDGEKKETSLSKLMGEKKKAEEKPAESKPSEEKPIDWKTAPKEFRERHEKVLTEYKTLQQKEADYQKRVSDYETKIKEIEAKTGDTSKADLKLVEEYTAKITALEEKIRGLDYSQSQEYQNLHKEFQEKYNGRYIEAFSDLKDFQVVTGRDANDEPVTRNFTENDFRSLLNKPLAEQRAITRSMFGENADVINSHLDALRGISKEANFTLSKKVEEARANGELRSKESRLAEQKAQQEYDSHVANFTKQFEEEYPDILKEPKDDPDGARLLKAGYEFADSLREALPKMTPVERAERNAATRAMIASWPLLNHRVTQLQAKYEGVVEELKQLRGSDPGNGGAKPASAPAEEEVGGIKQMAKAFENLG